MSLLCLHCVASAHLKAGDAIDSPVPALAGDKRLLLLLLYLLLLLLLLLSLLLLLLLVLVASVSASAVATNLHIKNCENSRDWQTGLFLESHV
jgi:hypothetical protein